MTFDYKRYHADPIRPVIPIILRNPIALLPAAVGYEALVDSGSDISIFPAALGELIGIDVLAGDRMVVGGVVAGAQRPAYVHAIEIQVGGPTGLRFTAPVAFMPDLSPRGHGLLGRRGFFDRFSFVTFQEAEGLLDIGALR
jgi:hypothetical protein